MSDWFPIPGWEDYYEVSDHGEVRSLDRITTKGQRLKGRMRVPNVTPSGYLIVALSRGSQRKAVSIHRLVAVSILGPCPEGYEVCHRNGKRDDNRISNLYYGTRSENNLDAVRHGTNVNTAKTHCKHGHEFSPDNTYWRPEGGRACRRCRDIWRARHQASAAA